MIIGALKKALAASGWRAASLQYAKGIEAQRGETQRGSMHESPTGSAGIAEGNLEGNLFDQPSALITYISNVV